MNKSPRTGHGAGKVREQIARLRWDGIRCWRRRSESVSTACPFLGRLNLASDVLLLPGDSLDGEETHEKIGNGGAIDHDSLS
jgi:hypothetical protein